MAKLTGLNLGSKEYENTSSFEPLPAGWYEAKIIASEVKETSTGGEMVVNTYRIEGGQYGGRQVFGRMNVRNNSEKAEKIGRQQLNGLLTAIGIKPEEFEDTDDLVGKDVQIKLKIREASGGYDASNDVSAFKALAGAGSSEGGEKKNPWS